MGYTIHDFKAVADAGNMRAVFAVEFAGVVYPGFRVVQQEGKKAWVSAPVEKTDEGYKTMNPLSDDVWQHVKDTVLGEWNQRVGSFGIDYIAVDIEASDALTGEHLIRSGSAG